MTQIKAPIAIEVFFPGKNGRKNLQKTKSKKRKQKKPSTVVKFTPVAK